MKVSHVSIEASLFQINHRSEILGAFFNSRAVLNTQFQGLPGFGLSLAWRAHRADPPGALASLPILPVQRTVTPIHDLIVTISLGFFLAVDIVLLHWLWRQRQLSQWIAGRANLTLLLTTAVVYSREVMMVALPTLQKLTFLSSAAWLLWLHKRGTTALASSTPA